jgi:hypothetical protein
VTGGSRVSGILVAKRLQPLPELASLFSVAWTDNVFDPSTPINGHTSYDGMAVRAVPAIINVWPSGPNDDTGREKTSSARPTEMPR